MAWLNRENVLSWGLAFVAGWFGVNEILSPGDWVVFAPPFLGTGSLALGLVTLHGVVLSVCALLLALNYYRRVAGAVLALVFVEVIAGLVYSSGLSDIAVRDIGLFAVSLALALRP